MKAVTQALHYMRLFFLALLLAVPGTIAISLPTQSYAAEVPKEIAGFKLDTYIDEYEVLRYYNFLKEVVVENIGDFRKGVIQYGVCDQPGKIVKIKLKYADTSQAFYRELIKRFKTRFGAPHKYTGDAFGILKSWKWTFTDDNGDRVTLSLQYNSKDLDESIGSVVKLSLPDRIEAERQCFNMACQARETEPKPQSQGPDWQNCMPH